MKNEVKACAASIVLCGLVAPAAAQERQTMPSFSYSEGVKRGDCKIAFRATDGVTTVDFGLGITDSVFTVEVLRSNWDIGEDRDPDTSDLPLTLTFQNGQSIAPLRNGKSSNNDLIEQQKLRLARKPI